MGESWDAQRDRVKAERERAEKENLCPVEVNEWARNDWMRGEKYGICLRKLSPDAVGLGHKVCGMHFRQIRKHEAENAVRERLRAQARNEQQIRAVEAEVKQKQEEAIVAELERHGVHNAELSRPWRYDREKRGWTVTIPLRDLWKVIDVLPMIDPDEAVEAHRKKLAAAEVKPQGEEAPF